MLLELVESVLDREALRLLAVGDHRPLPALGLHSFQIMWIILKVCQLILGNICDRLMTWMYDLVVNFLRLYNYIVEQTARL